MKEVKTLAAQALGDAVITILGANPDTVQRYTAYTEAGATAVDFDGTPVQAKRNLLFPVCARNVRIVYLELIEMGSQKSILIEEHHNNPCVAEADIKILLADLRKIKAEKDIACGHLIIQLQEIQEELRQAGLPFDHKSEVIEATIKDIMPAVGHTIKTEYGAANWRKGSVRVTYDYKALDAIMDLHVQAVIQQHRKATEIEPSVNIEIF